MLQGHRDDINANDEGDDEVQIVVCAECVDHQTHLAIAGKVGKLLGLCKERVEILPVKCIPNSPCSVSVQI